MYKQIFNKSDGTPLLIESIPNLDTGEEDFEYNEDEYTEEAPPCELYEPIRFENGKWQGAVQEDWEKENPSPVYEPTDMEKATANLQMQLMKSNITQMQAQKQVASLLLDNQKKDNTIKDLQAQQAQMMLEITKLKGGN